MGTQLGLKQQFFRENCRNLLEIDPNSLEIKWHPGCTSSCSKGGGNMKKILGNGFIALAFVFGMIATTSITTNAQWRTRDYGDYNNQEYQQGYQDGVNVGARDAQQGQTYSPERSRYYRNASTQVFRDGFVRGYEEGYRQYSGSYGNGGYRNDGSYGNGGYRNNGRYGNGGYGNNGSYNQEMNAGYQQGLNTGASDGQRNRSYDPQRSRYYQNSSSQAYRDGFTRGYDDGFRQYSRNNNRYRRGNSAATILDQIFRRP
jgi:flagellar biosynthesis/type III secretory pathway protein FliH